MTDKKNFNGRKENPILKANYFSQLFFRWMNDIFYEGSQRDLESHDLYQVLPRESSESLGDKLANAWEREVRKSEDAKSTSQLMEENSERRKSSKVIYTPSLRKAIQNIFLTEYFLIGIFAFIEECVILIVQPLFLGYLIRYFATSEYTQIYGWLFATGVAGSAFLLTCTHHPFFFGVQRVGSEVRIACCSLIYRKALRLSQSSLTQTTIGQMVNLLSNDVNRFDQSTVFLHYLWIAPIQTVIVTIILWQFFGPSCLVGIIILILFVPFQAFMGKCFSKLRIQTAVKTDTRIRVMNEFVNGMRVIKLYAWEIPFSALVGDSRKDEVKVIRRTNHLRAVNMGIFFISSKIIIFLTLLAHVAGGEILTAEKVFVTLCLFNNIRLTMTLFMPFAFAQLAEALVSIKRLQNFLLLEERKSCNLEEKKLNDEESLAIKIENFSAKWNSVYEETTLTDINLNVAPGQLVAFIGHVGSGKGSLLHAILQELPPTTGRVVVHGSIGYTAQEPWIFAGSVKENILFGKMMNTDWYEEVLEACALKRDLALLPYGDNTLIGDRGASLSGGQKARLALCRAVYANADIYILDDPLSAVDSEVGRHIFEKCINGILKSKTRILVTHQLQLLKFVNHIILMEGGKIQIEGTYEKLIESGIDFAQLLQNDQENEHGTEIVPNGNRPESQKSTPLRLSAAKFRRNRTISEGSNTCSLPRYESIALGENTLLGHMCSHEEIYHDETEHTFQTPSKKIFDSQRKISTTEIGKFEETVQFIPKAVDESRSSGEVPFSVYWKYFRSGSNYCILLTLGILSIVTQFLYTGCDFWLNVWTKAEESRGALIDGRNIPMFRNVQVNDKNNTNVSSTFLSDTEELIEESHLTMHVLIYGVAIVVFSAFSISRTLLFFKVCMDASVGLHNESFQGIMRAPMRFFEVNPLGRVLNRFSKDLGLIDDALPICFFDSIVIFMNVIGIMVLIGFVNPVLLVPGGFLAILFFYLRSYYMKTARSVKRLEGIVRSPVFSHLSSSLYGLTTIRAYGVQDEFIKQFDRHQDLHSSAWFLFIASHRWFGIRLDLISVIFITIVTYSFMLLSSGGSGPEVGLAISSVLVLSGMFQWGVRQSAEVSNQMVSVERVLEYTALKPEAPLESSPSKKPSEPWPRKGEIIFRNVFLRYEEDTAILQNLSFTIKPCEKLGIVGRTGAGKSSIISALFRIVEPSGEISIDGVNVLEIGLHDLRSKISIIPQDPVLFNGTIRKNLDPFQNYTDLEIWSVLEKIHLAEGVKEMPTGLETEIAEGGSNFSLGERQLMCLGRAILRKNKILVLDEATANVDPETDGLIQKTIRDMFQDCTVLTIAHRLNTVMDSDRILVLDDGKVKELDEPFMLLQNSSNIFYTLVQETGSSSADNLLKIAKEAFEKRRNL